MLGLDTSAMPNSPLPCHPERSPKGEVEGPASPPLEQTNIVASPNNRVPHLSILTHGFAGCLALTLLAPLLISCASPGPPRPPSLHLPDVPTDLTAQRVGSSVLLQWTTPSRTTDGFTAPSPLTAEICREPNPSTAPTKQTSTNSACPVVLRFAVTPGPSTTADPLPAPFTADPATLLAYRIRILNPEGRSAGLSKPALAAAGTAPSSVTGLHSTATRNGILLEWQPIAAPSFVELDRALVSPSKPDSKKSSSPLSSPSEPTEIHLRTSDVPHPTDPGGTLDRTALRARTYTYRATRLRTVTFNGHLYELRSDPSSPITVNLSDTFPPTVPTGLTAVPSNNGAAPTIDLSWEPNTDPDLAGYHVYRRTATGAFQRLTQQPVLGPAFSDTAVTLGTTYTYRVTAVDNTGNESPASTEVTETPHPL